MRTRPSLTVEIPEEKPKRWSIENGKFQSEGVELSQIGSSQEKINVKDLIKEKKLGEGASGVVWKVKCGDKPFALKEVRVSDNLATLLVQELANLYKTIGCKYIIQLYDAFYYDSHVSFLLEYMNAGTLDNLYSKVDCLSEGALLEICYQILMGLAYLHSKDILHRDLKPTNILLSWDGWKAHVKISDLGLSKETKSMENSFRGSFSYMSPERLLTTQYSFPSDIWSLGLILAECCAKGFPWEVSKDVFVYSKTLEKLKIDFPKYSERFNDLIRDCLIYDASKRLTAKELLTKYFGEWKDDRCDYIVIALKEYTEKLHSTAVKRQGDGKRRESFVTVFRSDDEDVKK